MPAPKADPTIDIIEISKGYATVMVRGTTPVIINRVADKAKRELLMPKGRKTAADKAASLKHDPIAEFRASPYYIEAPDAPTLLALTAGTFKAAMGTAALDLPGANKSQIGRLVYVEEGAKRDLIPIYGEPQLVMSVVRSADMNHTPDIRSRVIIPDWVAEITISFVLPTLRQASVINLLAAAGITAGVGDWRPQKGKGSYGQFQIVTDLDRAQAEQTKALWGRAAQQNAMDHPVAYDLETQDLLRWFQDESKSRGFEAVA